MTVKKVLAAMLTASIAAGMLASCGEGTESSSSSQAAESSASSASSTASSGTETAAGEGLTYPIEGNPTVTYWMELNSNVSASSPSMNDIPFSAALEEATGVNIEYIHPAQGTGKESFNLLVASGDLPDIIEWAWLSSGNYPGGPEMAFKNRVIEPINEHMAEWAPDYTAFLAENPDIDRMVRTDEGNYPGFPFIRGSEDLMVFYGPYVRGDWLDKLGLDSPTTVADWYEMLTAFKNELGATAPLTTLDKDLGMFNEGFLCGAWGVTTDLSIDENGQVIYGPVQPEFKEFLIEMNKWYNEGLIDVNFYTNDRAAGEANLMNDLAGASVGFAGSGIGVFQKSIQELDPSKTFQGVTWPVLNEGDRPMFGQRDFDFMSSYTISAVTASSENKEAAYALLNYGYTEEGEMLFNFGIEGESYVMEGDYPTYLENITNPGDGSTMATAMSRYVRSSYGGPFIQRQEYYDQYMQMDVQKDAVSLWKETDAAKHKVPPTTPTEDESREYSTIKTNMDTWRNEWVIGAITGRNDINNFESEFVAEMENIGLERALEIQNAALERYNNR